jgi:ABC-type glycerol-3-phosphate transport system permease component
MPKRTRDRLAAVLFHLAGLLVTVACLLPFFWVVVASLREPGLPPARGIEWWPSVAHWENYAELFRVVPMVRYVLNSLIVVTIAVPVTMLVAALAGFAISQLGTVWRRRLVVASVALLLIPGMAIWTLRFYVLNTLGLIDSLAALIAPAVAGGNPLFILLFYWACWRIPPELYESARLEGAGAWTVWWLVARPLVRPTTAAVAVLAFALYWGDFTTPVLYIFRPDLYTLPIGLQLVRQMDATNTPLLMAGSVLMILPVVVLFLGLQHRFFNNLSFGEVTHVN